MLDGGSPLFSGCTVQECILALSDPAKVLNTASLPSPVEGRDVTLVCTAEGNPAPHVAWIAPNGSYLQNGTSEARLTLNKLSRHDNATYWCNATNQVGSDSALFKLNAFCKSPIFPRKYPLFITAQY